MTFKPILQGGPQSWYFEDAVNANQTTERFHYLSEGYLARPARDLPVQVLLELGHQLHSITFPCANWAILAELLGYGRSKIEEFEVQGSINGDPAGFHMLLDWTQQEQGRSLFVLRDSLLSCDRHDCVRLLDDKIKEMHHMVLYLHVVDETSAAGGQKFMKVATYCDATLKDSLQTFLGSDDTYDCEYELVDAPLMARARDYKGKHVTLRKHLKGQYGSTASMSSSSDELTQYMSRGTTPEHSSTPESITVATTAAISNAVAGYTNPEIMIDRSSGARYITDTVTMVKHSQLQARMEPSPTAGADSSVQDISPISPNDNVFSSRSHAQQQLHTQLTTQNPSPLSQNSYIGYQSQFINSDGHWLAPVVWNTYPRVLLNTGPHDASQPQSDIGSIEKIKNYPPGVQAQVENSGSHSRERQSAAVAVATEERTVSRTMSKVVYITEDCVYCGKTRTIENKEGLPERTNLGIHCPSCCCGHDRPELAEGVQFQPIADQTIASSTDRDHVTSLIYSEPWDKHGNRFSSFEKAYNAAISPQEDLDSGSSEAEEPQDQESVSDLSDSIHGQHHGNKPQDSYGDDSRRLKVQFSTHIRTRSFSDPTVPCIADLQGKFDFNISDSSQTLETHKKESHRPGMSHDQASDLQVSPTRCHNVPVQRPTSVLINQSFSSISEVLRNFPGWCPQQTENTVGKSMSIFMKEDGHYIIWFMRSKRQLVISVSHMGKLVHYAIYQESIQPGSKTHFYIFTHQKFQNLRSLLRFHQQHGLDPKSPQHEEDHCSVNQKNTRDTGRGTRFSHVRLRFPYTPSVQLKVRTSV